jgi:hypothetical protein
MRWMPWMRGSALFVAGTLAGILIMATAASPQKKSNSLTLNHVGPGFSHAGILTDDLESTVAALQKKGLKVEDVHLGGTKALISNTLDPNGVRLELLAYPPDSLQRKAMNAWK